MAKAKKELKGKKSIFKRVLLFSALGMALGAIATALIFRFTTIPNFSLIKIGFALVGAGATVGVGVGVATAGGVVDVNIQKNKLIQEMDKIKKLDKDDSTKYSQKERKNLCIKYAKRSIKLSKKLGGSIFGEFHSESEVSRLKDTQRLNEIDAYEVLENLTTGKEKEKYKKKKQ